MKNIIDTVIISGNFKTLIKAIQEAGLIDIFRKEGPYTVFAPTDEAFSKIPANTMNKLLKDKEKLTNILTYHVVPDKLMAKDATILQKVETINGKQIKIKILDNIKIKNANIIKTDIICKNGIIHVIDEVLMPD